jgi:MFS transporter, PPP family, 3-phenylpropionic acid transporter
MNSSPASPSEDRNLWLIRLYYFMFLGGGGFLFPYIGLFFVRKGLTGTEIGLIASASAAAQLIAAPLWGRWSEAAAHPRRLLQIALIGNAVIFLIISQLDAFTLIALLHLVQGIVSAGMIPLSDGLALNLKRRAGYGSIRLWGSLGWALLVLVSGVLIERFDVIAGFIGYAVMLGIAAVVVNGIIVRHAQPDAAPVDTAAPERVPLRKLMGERSLIGLAVALVIIGLMGRGVAQFEPIYLDQLGASEFLIGLASTIGAATELPAMLLADRLLRRFSASAVFRMGIAAQIVRMGMVLIAPTVFNIVAMHIVEGVAYSFTAISLVMYVSRRAPARQVTTLLALYTVTLGGLISLAAGPLGGAIYDLVGAYWLYALALVGDVLALIVMFATYRPAPGLSH